MPDLWTFQWNWSIAMPGNLGVALLRWPGRPSHGRPMAWPMARGSWFFIQDGMGIVWWDRLMVSSNNSTAQLSRSDNSSLEIGLDICTCQDFTCNVYIVYHQFYVGSSFNAKRCSPRPNEKNNSRFNHGRLRLRRYRWDNDFESCAQPLVCWRTSCQLGGWRWGLLGYCGKKDEANKNGCRCWTSSSKFLSLPKLFASLQPFACGANLKRGVHLAPPHKISNMWVFPKIGGDFTPQNGWWK